jgi:transposase
MVPERTEAYAGVDVSKERLEVCVRRGREAKESEDTFGVSNDPAGTQTLLARLAKERPALVILEATGGLRTARGRGFGRRRAADRGGKS